MVRTVCNIEVIGLVGIVRSEGGDPLYERHKTAGLAVVSGLVGSLVHVDLVLIDEPADLEVRETVELCLAQQFVRHVFHAVVFLYLAGGLHYAVELVQEPFVDLGEVVYLVDGITLLEGL